MKPIQRFESSPRMSRVVTHDGVAYLAGLTADDLSQDIVGQTQQVLAKADARMASVGTDKSRLLMVAICLRNIADLELMNATWKNWIEPDNPPAQAAAESRLADDGILVEIIITAACSE